MGSVQNMDPPISIPYWTPLWTPCGPPYGPPSEGCPETGGPDWQACFAGVRLLPPFTKPAETMEGEYIPMILSLQWIIGFEKTSEMSSDHEIAAEFGFFPVSTKVKAQWACTNIFRRLKSYIISKILYYLFGNLLLLREDLNQIWNWWKHLWSSHSDGLFHWSQRVDW